MEDQEQCLCTFVDKLPCAHTGCVGKLRPPGCQDPRNSNSGADLGITILKASEHQVVLYSLPASLSCASDLCVFYFLFIVAQRLFISWRWHFCFDALLSEDPNASKYRTYLCQSACNSGCHLLGFILSLTTNDCILLFSFHHLLMQSLNEVSRL